MRVLGGYPVGDDHTWMRAGGPACPGCECCSAALCEVGRMSAAECAGHTSPGAVEVVAGCPCSARTTPGTAGHASARWGEEMLRLHRSDPEEADRLSALLAERAQGVVDEVGRGRALLALVGELWPDQVGS